MAPEAVGPLLVAPPLGLGVPVEPAEVVLEDVPVDAGGAVVAGGACVLGAWLCAGAGVAGSTLGTLSTALCT